MTVPVAGVRVPVGIIPLIDDAVGHAVTVTVRTEERMVHVDACVQDRHGETAAVDPRESRIGPEQVHVVLGWTRAADD